MHPQTQNYVDIIQKGGVILGPSDTCYGLFCDATNEKAVKKIFEIKQRDKAKPVSMVVSGKDMAMKYANFDEQVQNLWKTYTPGPYTLVIPRKKNIHLPVQMGFYIGIRVPCCPYLTEASSILDVPIVATSANKSGSPIHYDLQTIQNELEIKKVDYVDDQGNIPEVPPSTLIIWNKQKNTIQKIQRQ